MAENLSEATKPKPLTEKSVLESLANKIDGLKSDAAESQGAYAKAIKDAEEMHGVHREAFKLAMKYRRRANDNPSSAADFWRAAKHYFQALVEPAMNLDMFEDGEEEAPSPTEEPAPTNAIPLDEAQREFERNNARVAERQAKRAGLN